MQAGLNVLKSTELANRTSSDQNKKLDRRRELDFKISHGLLLTFLTLVLILQGIGIYLFTKGFLLTRLVLDNKSSCTVPPTDLLSDHQIGTIDGCWHPKSFDKAVILIIDALRYDFTIPIEGSTHHYHNAFPILHETAVKSPHHAVLRPFIADPPTTTLQRLKGLTTGSLPTFIEAGSNFAGNAIEEDNLITQLFIAGKSIVQLGDDTWQKLFPKHFNMNLTRPYDSFNAKDIHTVDNGVITHLIPLLHPSNSNAWDVLIGHFLGVDHVGHTMGPDDPVMVAKLQQMNAVLMQTIKLIDDSTVLFVFGDHGMDSKGNHGGESDDELEAALWMYSKRPFFGRSDASHIEPPVTAKERPVAQIDFVPTLALLLGIPIPFNNLGTPIEEAFIGIDGDQWQNMARVNRLAAAQIRRFQDEYNLVRELDEEATREPTLLWHTASADWDRLQSTSTLSAAPWRTLAEAFLLYQSKTLAIFKFLWATFDVVSMSMGISVLLLSVIVIAIYARGTNGDTTGLHAPLCVGGISSLAAGGALGYGLSILIPDAGQLRCSLFVGALVSSLVIIATLLRSGRKISIPFPRSLWGWACFLSVLLLAAGFGSNSFTVWEEEILLYMLGVFGTLMLIQSACLPRTSDRAFAIYHALLFMSMVRLSAVSRVCREEQLPHCSALFYASSTSTKSAIWQRAFPWIIALALPSIFKAYYDHTDSYRASAPIWTGVAFRGTLFLIASYWSLETFKGTWYGITDDTIELVRRYIAQLILAIAVGAGGATFGWQPPLVNVRSVSSPPAVPTEDSKQDKQANAAPPNGVSFASKSKPLPANAKIVVQGASNLYGSHFAILPFTILLLPLLLSSKPMGQFALFCAATAILSLLHLLFLLGQQNTSESDCESTKVSPLGPTILALLAHLIYFKTGHQAAFASIQWDMAFVATKEVRYPWSPIFMTLNMFSAQILCAAAVPAVVLWRRSYAFDMPSQRSPGMVVEIYAASHAPNRKARRDALLSDIAKAQLTHFLVYAIINLATTVFSAYLRRHLMLYRVFCPRWMLGGVGLIVAELAGCFIGVAGVSWTVGVLAKVWGW